MDKERLLLVRRMMLHNERPRLPKDEKDRAENLRAVRMITLIGCLDYAMLALRDALEERGMYVRGVKRNFNKASDYVNAMHKEVYDLVTGVNSVAGRLFSDLRDRNWWSIDEHISLGGIDGAYNIVMGLCRLITACNASISKRYSYRTVDRLPYVEDMLAVLGVEDRHLDFIIDKAVVVK